MRVFVPREEAVADAYALLEGERADDGDRGPTCHDCGDLLCLGVTARYCEECGGEDRDLDERAPND